MVTAGSLGEVTSDAGLVLWFDVLAVVLPSYPSLMLLVFQAWFSNRPDILVSYPISGNKFLFCLSRPELTALLSTDSLEHTCTTVWKGKLVS